MRSILYFNGMFLVILSFCMIAPILADLYFRSQDWLVFFWCMVITSFLGGCLLLGNTAPKMEISRKQAFILTTSSWVTLCLFGALPFFLCSLELGPMNSLFESVSGLTTTGATIITNLDHAPPGILMWRSMLQWIGGIMIIIMALTILPYLKVGGMHIFRSELSKDDSSLPRTAALARLILIIYATLTILCTFGYMVTGMEVFDAIAHSMTTISTGGFSTYDDSFAHYNNFGIEVIAMFFMILGSIPFILYLGSLHGNINIIIKDQQVRVFLGTIIVSVTIIFLYFLYAGNLNHLHALRISIFYVISMISGTGFFITQNLPKDDFFSTTLLFLMVVGGCAGSTTGGVKIFRFQVLYSITLGQLQKLVYPNSIYVPKYNKKALPEDVPLSVMGFLFVYAVSFLVLALGLSLTGLDLVTSLSGSIAAISNAGPGIGDIIGPGNTYVSLGDPAKLMLCFGMILGRLELFVILLMLSPYFWRH